MATIPADGWKCPKQGILGLLNGISSSGCYNKSTGQRPTISVGRPPGGSQKRGGERGVDVVDSLDRRGRRRGACGWAAPRPLPWVLPEGRLGRAGLAQVAAHE